MKRTYTHGAKGFSLVELLVVVGILVLLTGIIMTTFVSFRKGQALDKDAELMVAVLRQARSQTLASKNLSQYGVHFASSKITIFTGTTYSAGAGGNYDFPLNATDTIITINLVGGGSDVVFKRLSGETSQNGTIVVSSPTTSRTRTITIYKTGLVDSI
jgi:prepilin-type N-terminal cleavage/methylation domain-containing protein